MMPKKILLFITFVLLIATNINISYAKTDKTILIRGNKKVLEEKIIRWKQQNPGAMINNAISQLSTKKVISGQTELQTLETTGLSLEYTEEPSIHILETIPIKPITGIKYVAPGVIFIRGENKTYKKQLKLWKKANPKYKVTATAVEHSTDQVWTSKGYIRKLVARGMWVFFMLSKEDLLKGPQIKADKYVNVIEDGIVFISGKDKALQKRVSTFKKDNPHIRINSSTTELYTDQLWTKKGYQRKPTTKGLWLFYENKKTAVAGIEKRVEIKRKSPAQEPFKIGESYLSKATETGSSSEDYINLIDDASYWYNEVISDFPTDNIVAASKLRLLHINFLKEQSVSINPLPTIFSNYDPTILEKNAIYDLIPYFKDSDSLVNQLLLYQRLSKIYKNKPYSKEAYEATKKITEINQQLKEKLQKRATQNIQQKKVKIKNLSNTQNSSSN